MIDFAENRDLFIMFGILGWMMIGDVMVFPNNPQAGQINRVISYVAMIGFIFIWEALCTFEASKYFALKVIVRPSEKTLNWFVKRNAQTSQPTKDAPHMITTELPLGVKYKDKLFGQIDTVVLKHEYSAESRLIPSQGKINYKGTVIDHNSMCTIVVYELPESSFEIDHGQPIPTYYLANAPGDYNIGPINMMMLPIGNPRPLTPNQTTQYLIQENRNLKIALAEERRKASKWHTRSIQTESAVKGVTEEINGLLKNPIKFLVAVIQYVQSYISAGHEIDQLAKQGSFWKRIPSWIMYLGAFGILLAFFGANPQIQQGFGQWVSVGTNQLFLLLIVAMILIVVYYLFHRRSGK